MKLLGKNHVFSKESTLEYQQLGSSVLEEFKRRTAAERAAKKASKVVAMHKERAS